VVEAARAAVQEDDRRPPAHRRAVRHECRTVDVEPETRSVDCDVHYRLSEPDEITAAARSSALDDAE
jgi:hypothetical protein